VRTLMAVLAAVPAGARHGGGSCHWYRDGYRQHSRPRSAARSALTVPHVGAAAGPCCGYADGPRLPSPWPAARAAAGCAHLRHQQAPGFPDRRHDQLTLTQTEGNR